MATLEPRTTDGDANAEALAAPQAGRRRRWRLTRIGVPVAATAALVVVAVVALASGSDDSTTEAATSTAAVTRRDLVERETFAGTLGYDDRRSAINQHPGTLTSVADEGATVKRGQILYRVDHDPVYLMYGTTPAYRTMQQGNEGPDVRQLERELQALGFDDDGQMDVDGSFDADTAAAVMDWQDAAGLTQTGSLELGRIVFLDGPRRITTVRVETGGALRAGQPVIDTTSTRRAVTVDLDARRQDLAKLDARERVTLPDGTRVDATITEVGAVARAAQAGDEPTVEVTLVLEGSAAVPRLDSAPVDVEITSETRRGVLTVPVTALLALADGGFGVEVEGAEGERTVVSIEAGLFADGFVEVTGSGIAEGTRVVVPA